MAATRDAEIPQKLVEKSLEHAIMTPSVRGINERYVALRYLILKNTRYANTVNNGDRPLMVWTKDTGIFEVAYELSRCPSSWKIERGSAVASTSQEGLRSPFFNAGIDLFSPGKSVEIDVRMKHHSETEANWMMVKVAGFGKALRIDLDEVLVRAEVMYQTMQSAYSR